MISKFTFEVENYCCPKCSHRIQIPIQPGYSSPIHVMQIEKENELVKKQLGVCMKDVHELAVECLDYGMQPSFLTKLQAIMDIMKELKQHYGMEDR